MVWLQQPACQKTSTKCTHACHSVFVGSLIDAPPAHQDTILTSMLYMKKSLLDLDMQYAALSVDMQLHMVG